MASKQTFLSAIILFFAKFTPLTKLSLILMTTAGALSTCFYLYLKHSQKISYLKKRELEYNEKIVNNLNLLYSKEGTLTSPNFLQGSFRQFKNMLMGDQVNAEFILIYLHSFASSISDNFCRNVLYNPAIVEALNLNFCVWACDANTVDGNSAAEAFNLEKKSPSIVFAKFENRKLKKLDVAHLEINENDFYYKIIRLNEKYSSIKFPVLDENALLRAQQDEEYLASLEADMEKERLKKLEEEERKRKQLEEERLESIQKQQFEMKRNSVPPLPTTEDPSCIINLAFQLPNGKRLKRSFLKSNPVQVLYDFVDTHPDNDSEISDYQFIVNYPKASFPDKSLTIEEAKIPNNSLLFPMVY